MDTNATLSYSDPHAAAQVCGDAIVSICHGASLAAGWWKGPDDIPINELLCDPAAGRHVPSNWAHFIAGAVYGQKLALIHSEVSESLEGDRKSLPDDKLPQYPMRLVELADAMIRCADLAGAVIPPDATYTFGEVLAAKLAFNAKRADHKLENRAATGGKAY